MMSRIRFLMNYITRRAQVRVWNIPEQRVVDYADVHEMVTATAFAPDGRRAVVGTMKGRCRFYACEANFRLEYQAQIGARATGASAPWLRAPPGGTARCSAGRSCWTALT